ncbi:MAG: sodium:solute symporter family protein, partial [Thermoanaerobaculia bacterium]
MKPFDYLILFLFLIATLILGLYFSKKKKQNTGDFFLSNRNLSWWLAGTSMVAASFSSDTPLAVTEFVYKNGIYGNWYWWSFAIQGLMVTFLFSKLWRRAEILTDVEFFEFRYSGKSAAFLRAFKAFLGAVIANSIILGWVILAMATILKVSLNLNPYFATFLCVVIALIYSMASGLIGIVAVDFFQFIIAMAGSIILTVFAVDKAGGLGSLVSHFSSSPEKLHFLPSIQDSFFVTFLVYIGMQWWCASNADSGGGILVQRMLASKNPQESFKAMLWFNIAHYALRTWPWILCGLSILILFPGLQNPKDGYPMLFMSVLPEGLKGLMVASLMAAFMSTVDSSLSYSSAYLSHDLYRRFIVKGKDEKHYVRVSRYSMVLVVVFAALASLTMKSISGAWLFLTLLGSGAGSVKIARWYWWRINAWSEISAMASSLTVSILLNTLTSFPYWQKLIINILASAFVWITVTLLTKPVDEEKLINFYKKVKPSKLGWKKISQKVLIEGESLSLKKEVFFWILSVIFIYGITFSIGKFLLLEFLEGLVLILISGICFYLIYKFAL